MFVLFLLCFGPTAAEDGGRLELVQILFRHGDRTPIDPFPTDEWRNYWTEGYGQLTNIGKMQQYELGSYLRLRYYGFLNEKYNSSEIVINSTDTDRTLMSAYCNLAGLFPPIEDQKWDPKLDWQPIPVHTRPNDIDWLLRTDSPCPKYDELFHQVKNSPEIQKINAQNQDLFSLLTNKTGKSVTDIFLVSNIFDVLLIEQKYNLTLPEWASPSILARLSHLCDLSFLWSFKTPNICRLRGGPLVGEMVRNMEKKINKSSPGMKLHMYSAHDTTVASFLQALDVFNNIAPPYFASVLVELYNQEETYTVKIFYRNSTKEVPFELQLPGCSNPCSFQLFKKITASVIPSDIQKECFEAAAPQNIALISALFGSIVGCSLLLITVGGIMYWRRSNSNYRYLNVQTD